jgi:hypothetical protein
MDQCTISDMSILNRRFPSLQSFSDVQRPHEKVTSTPRLPEKSESGIELTGTDFIEAQTYCCAFPFAPMKYGRCCQMSED